MQKRQENRKALWWDKWNIDPVQIRNNKDENSEKKSNKLYQDDASEQQGFTDPFMDPNWRRPRSRREGMLATPAFSSRFRTKDDTNYLAHIQGNDWKKAKMAAKHLKFCPGEDCKQHLPLFHFGSNANTYDGLDIYCTACNRNKRAEKRERRTGRRHKSVFDDSFAKFKREFENDDAFKKSRAREIHKRIECAAIEARTRFKREIPVKHDQICERLFSGKYQCEVTGQILSESCFLDHHAVTFEVRKRADNKLVLDTICTDCRLIV